MLGALGFFSVALSGCQKPCDTTADCGADGMCVAAVCEALSCQKTIFAIDPQTGVCTPLSGCFLTAEQAQWRTCSDDPCASLDENSCVADSRCQPAYNNPKVDPKPNNSSGGDAVVIACGGPGPIGMPTDDPRKDQITAPGVNNGTAPKHPSESACGSSIDNSARSFSGCRTAPKIESMAACETLNQNDCQKRRDCSTTPPKSDGKFTSPGNPTPESPPRADGTTNTPDIPVNPNLGQCFSRFELPTTTCAFATENSCLLSPGCQPVGSRCYCPIGGQCSCGGGSFLGCESNDRLRRCSQNSDCNADERCDNDEACIAPRTFAAPNSGPDPVPGTASCVGACVKKGCSGMGETMCNAHPECDGGSYGTVCRPKPYCAGGDDGSPRADQASSGSCGCDAEFVGCAELKPVSELRSERSLLVRDPEIIDDAAFRLDTVLTKLAPAGKVDEFTGSFVKQIGSAGTLANGANVKARTGFAGFQTELSPDTAGIAQRLSGFLHITSLVNRLDLRKPGTCGEARLTYALTKAYSDGNQRMTLIVELRVPDDGNNCVSVAQRWAELSTLDSAADRRDRLIALYNELLKPETLGQIRTNEFLNRTGLEPWQLREFHLDGSGMLKAAAVAQTVDKSLLGSPDFLAFVQANRSDVLAGNAVIPEKYLAAASTEDGGRLSLTSGSSAMPDVEKALNAQACAGCHLTETQSPFVHIGERLGKFVGGATGYLPVGRAVIDTFLQKELVTRASYLQKVLKGTPQTLLSSSATGLARTH